MDKLSSNIYLNLIGIIMAAAFVKMRIRNNIRDQEVIIFTLRMEKKMTFIQILFMISATEGIAKLLEYHITFDKIVGNLYWVTFALLFFIVSGRKVVISNNGIAYRYWLGNLNYIFHWSNVQSYFFISSEKKHNNKITIFYMNEKFRIKKFILHAKYQDSRKLQNIFKEYVVEDNNLLDVKVTIQN